MPVESTDLKKGENVLPYRLNNKIRYFVYCSQEVIKGELWVRGYDTRNRSHVSRNFKEVQTIYP